MSLQLRLTLSRKKEQIFCRLWKMESVPKNQPFLDL